MWPGQVLEDPVIHWVRTALYDLVIHVAKTGVKDLAMYNKHVAMTGAESPSCSKWLVQIVYGTVVY